MAEALLTCEQLQPGGFQKMIGLGENAYSGGVLPSAFRINGILFIENIGDKWYFSKSSVRFFRLIATVARSSPRQND
jgi:hypothetical protein